MVASIPTDGEISAPEKIVVISTLDKFYGGKINKKNLYLNYNHQNEPWADSVMPVSPFLFCFSFPEPLFLADLSFVLAVETSEKHTMILGLG